MTDIVRYRLPFGLLGRAVDRRSSMTAQPEGYPGGPRDFANPTAPNG